MALLIQKNGENAIASRIEFELYCPRPVKIMTIIAAADVGGTTIKLALVQDSVLLARAEIPAEAEAGLAPALERMVSAWRNLCNRSSIPFEQIGAFGISFPGIIDPRTERVWITPAGKFEDSRTIDLQHWAQNRLQRPIAVCNDAKAALAGEWRFGAARGASNAAMMTLGTGVGTAVIMNGAPLNGAHGLAGNAAGHVTIDLSGPQCLCGNIGCVESEGSSWAMRRQAEAHPGFAASCLATAHPLDYKALFAAARDGDALAIELRDRSLRAWAVGAANMINNFDPEILIIGGGVAVAADLILPCISSHIRKHAWAQWEVPVVAAQLGNDAGLLGIAHLAAERL
ncbi:MAG: ROK family protein [Verrucomicrobiota bacterium]